MVISKVGLYCHRRDRPRQLAIPQGIAVAKDEWNCPSVGRSRSLEMVMVMVSVDGCLDRSMDGDSHILTPDRQTP